MMLPQFFKSCAYLILGLMLVTIYQNCSKTFVSQHQSLGSLSPEYLAVAKSQSDFSSSISTAHRQVLEQTFGVSHARADQNHSFSRDGFFDPNVYLAPVEIKADSFSAMLYKLDQAEAESPNHNPEANKLNYINMGMGLTPLGILGLQNAQFNQTETAGGGE